MGELHSDRFIDAAPAEVYATLIDERRYLCSVSTMYRILREKGEVRERRNLLRHPNYAKPELLATRPNELWTWDITKLKGPVKWSCFHLYVMLDVFSRYVVSWVIASRESKALACRFISEAIDKQDVDADELVIHADRGPSMRSKLVAQLMADLGVTKSHSRPYTATDNPYSESQFKTLKYRPAFPQRFGSIEDARSFCRAFFDWYNNLHRHSGIAYVTPGDVHYGRAEEILRDRQDVLRSAHEKHPERFVRGAPRAPQLPREVWINRPEIEASNAKSTEEAVH